MATDPRVRDERLRSDYVHLQKLRGHVIDFKAFDPPKPTRYEVKLRLRGIMSCGPGGPVYSSPGYEHKIKFSVPEGWPERPFANVEFEVPIFHPYVFSDGRVCVGPESISETIAQFVLRLAGFVILDPKYMKFGPDGRIEKPANSTAAEWCVANRRMLPVDDTPLPGPSSPSFIPGSIRLVKPFKPGTLIRRND